MNIECENCIKRKTMFCPNSSKCWNTEDKPYWQNRIMLLEENQQLKEENKILRENAEHNDKVVDKVHWENQQLKDDVRSARSVYEGLLDKVINYEKAIDKAIKIIEEDYYSLNTTNIDKVYEFNIPLQVRKILKGKK